MAAGGHSTGKNKYINNALLLLLFIPPFVYHTTYHTSRSKQLILHRRTDQETMAVNIPTCKDRATTRHSTKVGCPSPSPPGGGGPTEEATPTIGQSYPLPSVLTNLISSEETSALALSFSLLRSNKVCSKASFSLLTISLRTCKSGCGQSHGVGVVMGGCCMQWNYHQY